MKYFALSLGKCLLALGIFLPTALATDVEYLPAFEEPIPWRNIALFSGATLLGTIGISQLKNSEVIFAGLYGAGAVYYSLERVPSDQFKPEDYVVPFSLTTMAIANLTLLRREDHRRSTIAAANAVGLGLIALYWYNFERSQVYFSLGPDQIHLAFEF